MPKLDCPLQLSPVFKPKIWGRHDLKPFFARPEPERAHSSRRHRAASTAGKRELIGEVWVTDDQSRFMNGPVADLTLSEVSQKYGPDLNGSAWTAPRFPILSKYIYTSDWLSVQVHPDNDYARVHDPGSPGKSEMWYILHASEEAEILLGLKPGVSKEELGAAFDAGSSGNLMCRFHPRAHEAIYIPPGTVHALGPGLILIEVEQNSDLTYRLDDFGRLGLDGKPRPLHLKKGLDVTRAELPAHRDLPRFEFREPFGSRRFVMACPYFAVEQWTVGKTAHGSGVPERVEAFAILEGEGRMETDAGWFGYRAGDTWLIPPATGRYRIAPLKKTRALKFYVPNIEKDFVGPLTKLGVKRAQIERLCFD